ncbi:MAG: glutamate racemase [Lachnospiraceae bacterium]|nr:glutamate racemase [Lachnospiraceae bacterium]
MEKRDLPVAVFDSGVGGISVLRELVRLMPQENYYYFGDSIHAPYGTKKPEEIRRLTLENTAHMEAKGMKALVVACNTATSTAIAALREKYTDIPVVGIEPAVKPAVMEKEHPKVLVMATPMTVQAAKFRNLMERFENRAAVIPLGCPGLMEFVEAGKLEGPEVEAYLQKLLSPYCSGDLDAVVLGCTHYPFLRRAIAKVLGDGPHILDGSEGTARELKRRLTEMDLMTGRREKGQVIFEESIPEKIELCHFLLNCK